MAIEPHNIHPFKYLIMFLAYAWLRFDPVLRLGFGNNWRARYDFLAQLFGAEDAKSFFAHRGQIVDIKNKPEVPIILPADVAALTRKFLKVKVTTKVGRVKRRQIIKKLIFWATDAEINRENVDSYMTRSAIIHSLLEVIFHNSLYKESELILNSLDGIVFSRVTYLGHRGEPSPIVHNVILNAVSQLLIRHFSEIVRLRDQRVDKLTTIQLIKEISKGKAGTGSLAFSGEMKQRDEFQHKFPLSGHHVKLLFNVLDHYRYSAWPDSRQQAEKVIEEIESEIKTSLKTAVETAKD
jgi:hypothetical protein